MQARVFKFRVVKCEPLKNRVDQILAHWDKRIAQATWAKPRTGWREDMRRKLNEDNGSVVDTVLLQKTSIRLQRKPWNRGRLLIDPWQKQREEKSFYFTGGCEKYVAGFQSLAFLPYDNSAIRPPKSWPPDKIETFSKLQTVPAEFEALLK